jgi:hypothetical protein
MARFHAGVLGFSDEPFATASKVSVPDALGSGNSLTPLARMHSANFTASSWLVALLPAPVVAGALEPHALIRPTTAISASAASARRGWGDGIDK